MRDGTIKEGDSEYEITLAKIKGETAWQENAGVKVQITMGTAAAKTLLSSVKKIGENTNKKVAGMEPKIEALHANMHRRQIEQLEVEEKKLEVVQAKTKAKAEENEAFAKQIEASNRTPLEQKELQLKILAKNIKQHKAERALEKAREKAKRATTAPRPPAQISDEDLRKEIENGHRKQPHARSTIHGPMRQRL